jgi:hypothetical protein
MSVQHEWSIFDIFTAVMATVSAVAGITSAVFARRTLLDRTFISGEDFLRSRAETNQRRSKLSDMAAAYVNANGISPKAYRMSRSSLMSSDAWTFDGPMRLSDIRIKLIETEKANLPTRVARASKRHLPLDRNGRKFDSFCAAIATLARPKIFENRVSYRLIHMDTSASGTEPHMLFGLCKYFDMLNVGEPLAMEFGRYSPDSVELTKPSTRLPLLKRMRPASALPLRSALGDPLNLNNRPVLLAINTVTIRITPEGHATFFMHQRGGNELLPVAVGQTHVIPCGGFQPSSGSALGIHPDFDLWRNISREYAEELLGMKEADGNGVDQLDYENTLPYRDLMKGARDGTIRAWAFGAAFDPISYFVEFQTVAVFDSATFDAIFPTVVEQNQEGWVMRGTHGRGLDFTWENIEQFRNSPLLAPAGAACLSLSWAYRATLLGPKFASTSTHEASQA